MNEELEKLIQEAHNQGATEQDLDFIIQSYNSKKKPTGWETAFVSPGPDVESTPISGPRGFVDRWKQTPIAKTITSGFADILPQSFYGGQQRTVSERAERASQLTAKQLIKEKPLEFQDYIREKYKLGMFEPFNEEQWLDKADEYRQSLIDQRASKMLELESKIAQEKKESGERMKGVQTDLFEIKSAGDLSSWLQNAVGQAVYQIPAALVSGGNSVVLQESATVYDTQLDLLEEKTGLSREEIIRRGLDKPAVGQSLAGLASVMDMASALTVVGAFRQSATKSMTKKAMESFLSEFTTEAVQGNLERGGAAKGAGVEFDPLSKENLKESFNEAMAGGVGGLVLSPGANVKDSDMKKVVKEQQALIDEKEKVGKKLADEKFKNDNRDISATAVEKTVVPDDEFSEDDQEDLAEIDATTDDIRKLILANKAEKEAKAVDRAVKTFEDSKTKVIEKAQKEEEKFSKVNEENEILPGTEPTTPKEARQLQLEFEKGRNVQEKLDEEQLPSPKTSPVTYTPIKLESGKEATKFEYKDTAGQADGNIVGDKASILNIFAEKDEEGNPKKGGKLYNKVIDNLKEKGVKQIVVGMQSPASTGALQKLQKEGIISPAEDSELDINDNPIRFNINEQKQESPEIEAVREEGAKEKPIQKKKTIQEGVKASKKAADKIRTPEGTIDLETGDVKAPTKKTVGVVGRPRVSKAPIIKEASLSPNPSDEDIKAEGNKFKTMYKNRSALNKPSQKLERLKGLQESIAKSKFPESHSELSEKVASDIAKLEGKKEQKAEIREKKESKKVEKEASKPKLSEEEKNKVAEEKKATEAEIENIEAEKKAITEKYSDLRDKRGNVLRRAVEQSKWDPMDVQKVREINVRLEEGKIKLRKANFNPKQAEKYEEFKANGLDEKTAVSLAAPEKGYNLSPEDIGLGLNSTDDPNLGANWSNLKEVTESDLKSYVDKATPIFSPVAEKMLEVIKLALNRSGKTFRIFEGQRKNDEAYGEAIRDSGNFYVILNKDWQKNMDRTAQHELAHIFEFAINSLEGGNSGFTVPVTESWKKINNIYNQLIKDLDTEQYGLKNPREMVAEAMSNPYFATLLATIKPSKSTGVVSKNISYLKQIYDTLKDLVNEVISYFKLNTPKLDSLDGSYLNEILSVFEDVLQNTDDRGGFKVKDLTDVIDAAYNEPTLLAKESASSKLSEALFNKVLKEGIKDSKALKKYLKNIEEETGEEIENRVKAGVGRKLRNRLKQEADLKSAPERIAKALKTEKADQEIDYRIYGEYLEDVDTSKLTWKQKVSYINATDAFITDNREKMKQYKAPIQNIIATQQVDDLLNTSGFQFREFKTWIGGHASSRFVNLPTFLGYISKYSQEHGPKLMKAFHDVLAQAHSNSQLMVNRFISELNEVALQNKLSNRNFRRVNVYSNMVQNNPNKPQTIEQKYKDYREMLMLRLEAAKRNKLRDNKPADVEEEIKEADEIYNNFINGTQALTKEEMAYYDKIREVVQYLEPSVKANAEIAHGEEFVQIENYAPTLAIGVLPTKLIGEANEEIAVTSGQSDVSNVTTLEQALHPTTNWNPMSVGQSGFEMARRGGKGVYYDTNLHSVMARYLNSTIFDIHAAQKVQVLSKMFKGKNKLNLDAELGVNNTEKVYDYLLRAIKSVKKIPVDYDKITRMALALKNTYQTAKIGTGGQLFNQLFAMVPAIAVQTGIGNASKAAGIMYDSYVNDQTFDDLSTLISMSSQLKVRDFFFEKYESVEDVAKAGIARGVGRWQNDVEHWMTKAMTWSDKTATTMNFLAAFIEAGGDINDRATWTRKRIAAAELKSTQLQNVSTQLFMAPALRQKESSAAAFWLSTQWAFKSFALNAMGNALLASPDAFTGNKEAAKVAGSHLVSALAYEGFNMGVKFGYGAAAVGAVSLLTGDEPDWPEISLDDVYNRTLNAFYNFFFGGLPSLADSFAKYAGNFFYTTATGKEQDTIYAAKDWPDIASKGFGPYSSILTSMVFDPAGLAMDVRKGKKVGDEKIDRVLGKMFAEFIVLASIIPFRGDISKLINTYASDQKKEAREKKDKKKSRRKLKKIYR